MPSPFVQTAEGGTLGLDRDEVARALRILVAPGQTFELRGITPPRGAHSRICNGDDIPAAVEAAWDLSGHKSVYFTLNPCRPGLDKAAADDDILRRRWLLIDADATRAAGTNATADEKESAGVLAWECNGYLDDLGWCDPLVVDSGNGFHLLYPVDLDNDDLSRALCKSALEALAARFRREGAAIDTTVANASRISKLPGTWVRKGPKSEERPHRRAEILRTPRAGGPVTAGQLQALAARPLGPDPDPDLGDGRRPSPFTQRATRGPGDDLTKYVAAAIRKECSSVAFAGVGGRNNALNRAAFNLATMAANYPELDHAGARAALLDAATEAGLGRGESERTIESGWGDGLAADPRARPTMAPDPANGRHAGEGARPPKRLTVGLDEVVPRQVDWIWEDRIAAGFVSVFAGRTGMGKSFVLSDVAARLSRGEPPPSSTIAHAPSSTLIVSEDPVEQMLAPRLMELGADRSRIRFMTWEAMGLFTLENVALLEGCCAEFGTPPRLLVIDPPTNFLGKVDEHRNAEIRAATKALIAWIDARKMGCVLVTHINKATGQGLDAVERIMGSIAWGSISRVGVAFARDPDQDGVYVCGGSKSNLGRPAGSLAYRIARSGSSATIEWLGATDVNIEDAMNKVRRKSRGACAVEWLTDRFREKFEWESEELKKAASEAGLSKNALWSPKAQALPIRKRPRIDAAGDKSWWWIADPGWPPPLPNDGEPHRHTGEKGNKESVNGTH